jgi:hypothetical protein
MNKSSFQLLLGAEKRKQGGEFIRLSTKRGWNAIEDKQWTLIVGNAFGREVETEKPRKASDAARGRMAKRQNFG